MYGTLYAPVKFILSIRRFSFIPPLNRDYDRDFDWPYFSMLQATMRKKHLCSKMTFLFKFWVLQLDLRLSCETNAFITHINVNDTCWPLNALSLCPWSLHRQSSIQWDICKQKQEHFTPLSRLLHRRPSFFLLGHINWYMSPLTPGLV